MIFKIINV